tara:strand:+ start:138 stop:359 length:222 start_codon:yes stop_codon:yes gene_type:complete
MSRNKFAAYVGTAIPCVSVVGLFVWAAGNEWRPDDIVISGDFIYDLLSLIAIVGTGLGSGILGSMAYDSIRKK